MFKHIMSQREWADDIVDWCRASLEELSYSAQSRTKWNKIIKKHQTPAGTEPNGL